LLVYLPASYTREPGQRYPVAYLLHGRTGNEADWIARGDLDAVADSVFAHGSELILVMPDGDNSFWVNWAESPGYAACARDSLLIEAAASFCVPTARYGDYLAHDLVAYVDSAFRSMPARAHRGLLGLSMGGTGALTLALSYPQVFAAALAFSAPQPFYLGPYPYQAPAHQAESLEAVEQALGRKLGPMTRARWGADTAGWWRHDPERAARRLVKSGGPLPALRLEVGSRDPYVDENRALAAALSALGVPHQLRVDEGAHEWSYWRAHSGAALAWLEQRLAP
jgi:S-formylglutathione hydrolase FrmB